jgi:ubiquinone/menaquinone biosynthesis C-methylase UbiE
MTREAVYTHGHHPAVLRSHQWRTAENSAGYLLPYLRPGDDLLDVGCGPGTITADLAQRVAPGRVVGLDQVDGVLAQARAVATERGLTTVDLTAGDVHALEFPDGTFDVVHAHQVLQHVSDPVAALREMRRVCRPGGVVAARDSDYASFVWYPHNPVLTEWLALYRALARMNGGEPDAARHLLSWAQHAGFADVTATASTWCFATPADRAWWGGMWSERVIASGIADQAVQSGLATPEDLARMSTAWQEWSDAADGWFALLHGEIVCRP